MVDIEDAAASGDIAAIERLLADGAHVSERGMFGATAIMVAAMHGSATTVKFLQAAGASITEKDYDGWSALHYAAHNGRMSLLQYFFQEAGASISAAVDDCRSVWDMLVLEDADPMELASLLKLMVMLGDAPPAFVAKLSPAHAEITTRGRNYRAQLPSYLEQQRASVIEHCPLPPVLL
jgi:ankyrin repeat protein